MLYVIAVLGGLITFYVINAVIGGLRYRSPARIRISFATPADHELAFEDITLVSGDGIRLAGWYVPSSNRAAVILLHGYSGNRLAVMSHAVALARGGFGVLMFDLRAHGHSEGSGTFARSKSLVSDAQAAVTFLQRRPDIDPERIGVFGVSIGGTMALQSAASITAIRAVMSDGAGAAAYDDLLPPGSLVDRLFLPLNRLFFRIANRSVSAVPMPPNKAVMNRIAPRPVLLVAAGRGSEYRLNQALFDAAAEPKSLWQIEDAHHAGGWHKHPEDYFQRLVRFFSDALLIA